MNIINPYRFAAAGGITDPTDIAGLDLWLDASDNSTVLDATDTAASDDEAVKTWQDKSGNANHAVQSTVANQPLRRAAEVNSLDALDFDGVDDFMAGAANLTPRQTDDKTVFIVCASDTTVATDVILGLYDDSSAGSGGNFTPEISYRINNRTWISSTPCSTTGASLISMTQAASGNLHAAVSVWLDGASVTRTGGTDGAFVSLACSWAVGSSRAAGGFTYDGRLCEIVIYNSELSTTDRQAVETYLADKWGITL